MNILFLGPPCPALEQGLARLGHEVRREDGPLTAAHVRAEAFAFGLSYRYRHMLPQDILDLFGGRFINLHLSLLPWNRGSDPHLWSFLEDTPKGVTIHRIDAGLDTGDILLQEEVHFDEVGETLATTYAALSGRIERLFLNHAPALLAGSVPARKQPAGGSRHQSRDMLPYLPLLEKSWWETPVHGLKGRALTDGADAGESALLIPVTPDHKDFLFQIINDPQVRAMSFDSRRIDWRTHCAWFSRRLEEKIPFYVGLAGNEPCGYVRFQAVGALWDAACEEAVVSMALHPQFRGRGLAKPLLRAACLEVLRTTGVRRIHASVKSTNTASLATFRGCHFAPAGTVTVRGNPTETFIYPGYEE